MTNKWIDGTCNTCGYKTYGTDAIHAPSSARGDKSTSDYYVWCENRECDNHIGECVGDMECPPEWASH